VGVVQQQHFATVQKRRDVCACARVCVRTCACTLSIHAFTLTLEYFWYCYFIVHLAEIGSHSYLLHSDLDAHNFDFFP